MTTPAMDTALRAPRVTIFGALRIALSGGVERLLDGAGEQIIEGETYKGKSTALGVLDTVDAMSDGAGDEAPAISFGFLPPDASSIALLSYPAEQGASVKFSLGAIVDGSVVADPILLFDGELDQVDVDANMGTQSLSVTAVSAMERFFDNQEGVRLSPTFHKTLFPGETGLDNVTGVARKVYWGVEAPGGTIVYGGGGGREPFQNYNFL